ncbi:DoxX family protein [Erythrobacter insulae]|uniref:DoxX family protein n=1 Tax=Erythrobacter insulae TaxID=2584124 RepID=A0A547PCA8_9SPHN|nr:DoxX family protein [Erythrobacter insulae]TRD11755.1 DoxX family protein [Erythrobacter insulae]
MSGIVTMYNRLVGLLSGTIVESIAQLFARIALAGIFWRSYKTKVVEGTWLKIDETQYFIFENEFSGLPIPTDLAVPMATYSEFLFPILLVLGLFTRFSALALMGMAVVIQLFVFPDAAHFFGWAITVLALGAFLVSRGGGAISLDAITARFMAPKAA